MRTEKTEITVFLSGEEYSIISKAANLLEKFAAEDDGDFANWVDDVTYGTSLENLVSDLRAITQKSRLENE